MNKFFVQNQSFTYEEVKEGAYQFQDEYYHETLNFCRDWLRGKETFTFNTSGSTGSPKSIITDRKHMQISAQGTIDMLGLTSNEKIYLCISSKMIGGAMLLVRGMILGCDITITAPSSNPLASVDSKHEYTLVSFAPMQVFALHEDEALRNKLSLFKHVLLGGAPADKQLLNLLGNLPCKVWQTYGMTETLSHVALRELGKETYYKVMPDVKIRIDERNCLCICAPVTDDQWLVTNDVVKLIDDTHFELLGRIDEVINSGGIKFFSYDIEHAILERFNELEMPPRPMFVCRKTDEKFGEIAVVVMLGEPLNEEMMEDLKNHCKATLGKYAAPKKFYFVDEFERLESGKPDRKATIAKVLACNNA